MRAGRGPDGRGGARRAHCLIFRPGGSKVHPLIAVHLPFIAPGGVRHGLVLHRAPVIHRGGRLLGVSAAAARRRGADSQPRVRADARRPRHRPRNPAQTDRDDPHAGQPDWRRDRPGRREDDRRGPVLGGRQRPSRRLPAQRHPAGPAVPRPRDGRAERRVARARAHRRPVPRHRARGGATASSTPASSSTAASPTSARPASWTGRS